MATSGQMNEWLGLVETVGPFLVPSVLDDVFPQGLDKVPTACRRRLRAAYEEWEEAVVDEDTQLSSLHDAWLRMVLAEGLGLDADILADDSPVYSPDDHDEQYQPDLVLRSRAGDDLLYIDFHAPSVNLAQPLSRGWVTSAIERMGLLCRSRGTRMGLVTNGEQWVLVNAPADNSSGQTTWYARFWWQEPVTFQAFASLLGVRRFFGPTEERLDHLLERSLKEHHEVTDTLGEQVHRAVEVLIQSLGHADDDRNGELLKGIPPADLYNAGLTVMMRLVFLLCAEERELLLLGDPVYDQHYAISTLRAKLREDADQHGEEVLERRYDAWSRLLSVFRGVYGGIEHESLRMPAMGGSLFDPDRFAFLEGRTKGTSWKNTGAVPLPIDNRTVMLLLRSLQVLEHRGGARQLSYRGLDVEQIGHVYEGLLEYKVERVPVLTMGLLGSSKVSRPAIGLQALETLMEAGVAKAAGELVKVTGRSKAALTKALKKEPEGADLPPLVHACGGDEDLARRMWPFAGLLRTDSWGVPLVYKAGSFAVTLGAGRRESGSHYTPKALTEPIVATTLRPILEAMGEQPTAEQLLALKVCDPAMGSGAFLVEACRQIGAHVVEAWTRAEAQGKHITIKGAMVNTPGDAELLSAELADRLVTARRLVTERCLYGVDKNPMAVDLAKLSLWLVTMAKGRPFGFLDHKLKYGDALVGLTKTQIQAFHWKEQKQNIGPLFEGVQHTLDEANEWRRAIGDFGEFDYAEKQQVYGESEKALKDARLMGDLCIAAFFNADKDKAREELRRQYRSKVEAWRAIPANQHDVEGIVKDLRSGEKPVPPMHWEIEFPEVFGRENPGFDAMVGNPPFISGADISTRVGFSYNDYLFVTNAKSSRKADIGAYFFRQSFQLLRGRGAFGLIGTNTIAQTTTRRVGLDWITSNEGRIYEATTSRSWPGAASVVVSFVWVTRGPLLCECILNGKKCKSINTLLKAGSLRRPLRLAESWKIAFNGSCMQGRGFFLSQEKAAELKASDPKNVEVVRPCCGGRELNLLIDIEPPRWIIDMGERSETEAQKYASVFSHLEAFVRPERVNKDPDKYPRMVHSWWKYWHSRQALYQNIKDRGLQRVLVRARVSGFHMLRFLPSDWVYTEQLVVFALDEDSAFTVLQSNVHNIWARSYASTMKRDLRYVPPDCFETFPFPENWQNAPTLEAAGKTYYEFRTELMVRNDEGLTKTYNRFHDPDNHEPNIVKLRELHAAMDRAALDAYGWDDISTDCEFLLDYEIDEETWGNKKKPYRYRWPEAVHDEVLARLLDLNQKRYQEEVAQGLHGKVGKKKAAAKPKPKAATKASPAPPKAPAQPHRQAEPPNSDVFQMGTKDLVALGTPAARKELERRGRDPITGKKDPQGRLF